MTQISDKELAVLKVKAEAATEGPWFDIDFSLPEVIGADKKPSAQDIFVSCCYPDPITVATMHGGFEGWESIEQAKKDAAFIADANPATVLSLISTITQLRARAEAADRKGWNSAIEAAVNAKNLMAYGRGEYNDAIEHFKDSISALKRNHPND